MIYVNNQKLEYTKSFSGEIQGKFTEKFYSSVLHNTIIKDTICVIAYLFSSDKVFLLAQLKQFLNENFPKEQHILRLPYQPYGRYTRKMNSDFDVFSLKIFTSFLNSMNWDEVIIPDPYNSVVPALINKSVVQEQHEMLYNILEDGKQYDAVIASDINSMNRVRKYSDMVGLPLLVYLNGKVIDIQDASLETKKSKLHFLIVSTFGEELKPFIDLATSVKEQYRCTLDLYVSHNLFSDDEISILSKDHYLNVYSYEDYDVS